ncbi:MAG: AAA family ATPase [Tepidanaerobacter acetatoxydans]|uniref:ATP-binding protein n=1 Tax=Tepidanaerobacter acetatoxydans TaxID=499229 RepID=UPI0026F1AD6A|nr:carbon monoxide dehydrogenase accessory protein CooC [Tepidanaerobacter acetatoxydans]NLU09516.1 AAA family ATPase [Tepidanaerobacter acetatoxydans]
MKIAITGKGGVGKTTFAGVLSKVLAEEGYRVLAVDADPDANLPMALGIPEEKLSSITPLSEIKDIIAKRTEAVPGVFGQMFKLNPKVDDIPEKYCIEHDGIKLLVMGTVKAGGSGCICPEHAFLRALMQHLLLTPQEALIMDMEAGIEHLGRATADCVDAFIVVAEPGQRSIQTLKTIKKLALDIGIQKIFVVGNKIRTNEEKSFIINACENISILGFLPYDAALIEADRQGKTPFNKGECYTDEVRAIKDKILNLINN